MQGVHAVGVATEIVRVEAEPADRLALLVAEVEFDAQPAALFHAHEITARVDQLFDLVGRKVVALDLDDDLQVEPVDLLVDHLELQLRLHRIAQQRLQLGIRH